MTLPSRSVSTYLFPQLCQYFGSRGATSDMTSRKKEKAELDALRKQGESIVHGANRALRIIASLLLIVFVMSTRN
jgi:hypothetical protein